MRRRQAQANALSLQFASWFSRWLEIDDINIINLSAGCQGCGPRAGIPASLIEIEITESLLVKDSATVRSALERLRQIGCRIALDDFGTGYSSLAYITRFPPDRIKIDKAFVNNVDRSPSDAAVANAILSLGKSLNLVVTAEGIERSGQLEWLRARGCDEVQGFLLSRPLSARDLENRYLMGSGQPAERPPRVCAASDP